DDPGGRITHGEDYRKDGAGILRLPVRQSLNWGTHNRVGNKPRPSLPDGARKRMIRVDQLTKTFLLPGGGSLTAVNGVSFTVEPGEVYGLLGPNGAGKTTTLRMILGLLQPTRGQASIAGFGSSQHPDEVKRRVGLVAANAGLYPGLTVREMLLFFADLYAVPEAKALHELTRLTELLGLGDILERRCANL